MPNELLPILDFPHLHRATMQDRALERDLLVLFEGQCARLVPAIVAATDGRERAEHAHGLLGAARAVGARRLAGVVAAIEVASLARTADADVLLGAALGTAAAEVRGAVAVRLAELASRDGRSALAKARGLA